MSPNEVEMAALKEKAMQQVAPGRLRQFRRRSAQQKKERGDDSNKKNKKGSQTYRKAPLPPGNSPGNNIRLPAVQIVDPKQEALDYRRKQLKIGKIRPKTESEIKFINEKTAHNSNSQRSPGARKMTLAKNSKIKLPEIGESNRNLNERGSDSSTSTYFNNDIGKLPETLVDSLAISDGQGLLEGVKLDDFEGLTAVQAGI